MNECVVCKLLIHRVAFVCVCARALFVHILTGCYNSVYEICQTENKITKTRGEEIEKKSANVQKTFIAGSVLMRRVQVGYQSTDSLVVVVVDAHFISHR